MTQRILVTGPFGQIGSQLVLQLQKIHGIQNVIALGHKHIPQSYKGTLEKGDINDKERLKQIIINHKITQIYHLAAVLSVTGQVNPQLCWNVNLLATKTILDLAVQCKVSKVFWASSIAVFGDTTPKVDTPQNCSIQPKTMYGITKYTGQMLCAYYFNKYALDVRSLRYPGLISWKQLPGGGTTDYAIGIFYDAIQKGKYECFVNQQTKLPMMYMDDAVNATIQIMSADKESIKNRMSYNLSAISFTVGQLADLIKKKIPNFQITYKPDFRQKIADSWPDSIDDNQARKDWGWKHSVDLPKLVQIMLQNLSKKLK